MSKTQIVLDNEVLHRIAKFSLEQEKFYIFYRINHAHNDSVAISIKVTSLMGGTVILGKK